MVIGICPECDGEVSVSPEIEIGDFVSCPDCGVELEVIETDPLEFDIAPGEEEYFEEEEDEW
jgi:alpha-aminoadipate carrier protein LysW